MHINIKKAVKRFGRFNARVEKKTLPYVAPVVTAAATVFGGVAAGAAVGGAMAASSQYIGATAARSHGKHGRDARAAGRKLRKTVGKNSLIGLGGGAAVGVGVAVATGTSVATTLGTGIVNAGAFSPPEAAVAGDLATAAQPASPFVTSLGQTPVDTATAVSAGGAGAGTAGAGGIGAAVGGLGSALGKILGQGQQAGSSIVNDLSSLPGQLGDAGQGILSGLLGGGGGGGGQAAPASDGGIPTWMYIAGAAALLLMMKKAG